MDQNENLPNLSPPADPADKDLMPRGTTQYSNYSNHSPAMEISFWTLVGFATLVVATALVISIMAVLRDKERITLIEEGQVSGSLDVADDLTVDDNLRAFTDMQVERYATAKGDLISKKTEVQKQISFVKAAITSPTLAKFVEQTTWVKVGLFSDQVVTLQTGIPATNGSIEVNTAGFTTASQVGFLEGTQKSLISLKTNSQAKTSSWLALSAGNWIIVAQGVMETKTASDLTGTYVVSLVAYDEDTTPDRSVTLGTSTLDTSQGSPLSSSIFSFSQAATFPVSTSIGLPASYVGLTITGTNKGPETLDLYATELTISAFKSIPSLM